MPLGRLPGTLGGRAQTVARGLFPAFVIVMVSALFADFIQERQALGLEFGDAD